MAKKDTRNLSPQGYNITVEPLNENPFWEQEEKPSIIIDDELSTTSENPVQNKVITSALLETNAEIDTLKETKQNVLTFDTTPTYNSNNPVTSNGIRGADVHHLNLAKAYTDEKIGELSFVGEDPVTVTIGETGTRHTIGVSLDRVPTENSINLVNSGTVYEALAQKQNTLTFDITPTYNSTNPVTSSGIRGADVYHLSLAKAYTDEKIAGISGLDVTEKNAYGGYKAYAGQEQVITMQTDISNLSEGVYNCVGYIDCYSETEIEPFESIVSSGAGFNFTFHNLSFSTPVFSYQYLPSTEIKDANGDYILYVRGGYSYSTIPCLNFYKDGNNLKFVIDVGTNSTSAYLNRSIIIVAHMYFIKVA